ncbi:MAG: dihydroneopterin aldolase [Alphaproteobacteria bacterium]|uniref:7,8-dihydroneopterin aldolase n=1 Tax=Pseudorhizobium pelagicum TaxID=1509405 RepID=A0A922P5J7_9HYPH|nr:dihydroneopterin aldolase [Pseudorhizobium pelagicum]MBA4784448.1 dihydroneopterin aldolase [Hyphomicrobiales bacterium]MBU1315613.1 dihydroneopterin aldolase [Alphaproteobacteria bacterium]MDY6960592.1 dihydroneopterin aldolase [Pseudomonadota bacterium]KEQ06013.1 dienelactone hydrolase [Pseudorhizobium pelagicum]KEQ11128.1 dienelactone hydrolase [Pseudorhizobium pelagicum]
MTTYTITLKNCAFFARHGVLDQENTLGQRFFVDAAMEVEAGDALETDLVEQTVDYGLAFALIERVVTGQQRKLIETLAFDIAKALCARFAQIRHVEITVRKPSAPVQGVLDHAEVRVEYRPV